MRINFDIAVDFTVPIAPVVTWFAVGLVALVTAFAIYQWDNKRYGRNLTWKDWVRPKEMVVPAFVLLLGGPVSAIFVLRALHSRVFQPPTPTREPRRLAPAYNTETPATP